MRRSRKDFITSSNRKKRVSMLGRSACVRACVHACVRVCAHAYVRMRACVRACVFCPWLDSHLLRLHFNAIVHTNGWKGVDR
jgi:hypothetical protein